MALQDRFNFEALPERELQGRLIKYFANYFFISSEVTSSCGKRRIDLLMHHYSDTNKEYPIGIELKKTSVKRGTNIAEAYIYAPNAFSFYCTSNKRMVFR